MKNLISCVCYCLVLMVLLVSCKSRKPVEPDKIKETHYIKEVIRDTVITVKADSTYYDAWIECVNGKPVLREPVSDSPEKVSVEVKEYPYSKAALPKEPYLKPLQKPKVTLDENGRLSVECKKEVEQIKAQLINKYESRIRDLERTALVEKDLKWWQKTLMWLGVAFLGLVAFVVIIKLKK
ncbi:MULTISPECIES: hypothetical protein [Elizabethkingia]|uniref:hypothetical protein n=1 Tax=Elizabethkingia TaxID=308865 RepID=UPI001178478B|nr:MULTISPECIES: hypothetical protein [Elizabethkingia]